MENGWKERGDIRQIGLDEIVSDEVKFVSFAYGGAMGDGGAVEVYCVSKTEVKYYYGNYVYQDLDLTDFFTALPDTLCNNPDDEFDRLDQRKWVTVPMGMGNTLYVDIWTYLLFTKKLREIEPGHIYQTWHKGAEKALFEILDGTADYNHSFLNIPQKDDFWGMLAHIKNCGMCFTPGCTTCGCMEFRKFIKSIGKKRLAEILNAVTLQELQKQNNLDWHDALEIILIDFGPEMIKDSVIFNEYNFVHDKYYELRSGFHMKPYEARLEVIRLLKEKE